MKLSGTKIMEESMRTIKDSGLPIISISLKKPLDFGRNIVFHGNKSITTLFNQIITGLLISEADYVFFCEHDVLYHPSHFDFTPKSKDKYYYNNNVYKYRLSDRKIVGYDCNWLSQLCASRELLIEHYSKRLKIIANGGRAYGYEPGSGQSKVIDDVELERWESEYPNIDIRHGKNLTGVKRMDISEFKSKKNCKNWKELTVDTVPYWDKEFLLSL